jgi:hypothetical protein
MPFQFSPLAILIIVGKLVQKLIKLVFTVTVAWNFTLQSKKTPNMEKMNSTTIIMPAVLNIPGSVNRKALRITLKIGVLSNKVSILNNLRKHKTDSWGPFLKSTPILVNISARLPTVIEKLNTFHPERKYFS